MSWPIKQNRKKHLINQALLQITPKKIGKTPLTSLTTKNSDIGLTLPGGQACPAQEYFHNFLFYLKIFHHSLSGEILSHFYVKNIFPAQILAELEHFNWQLSWSPRNPMILPIMRVCGGMGGGHNLVNKFYCFFSCFRPF